MGQRKMFTKRPREAKIKWESKFLKILAFTSDMIKYLVRHSELPANPSIRNGLRYVQDLIRRMAAND